MKHSWEKVIDETKGHNSGKRIHYKCSNCGCIKRHTSTGIKYYRKDIYPFKSHVPICEKIVVDNKTDK